MCGRYAIFTPPHKLKDMFGCGNLPNFPPRYNAAPLQEMPMIVRDRMGMARWGFLPPWVQDDDKASAAKMINARSETISEKPAFQEAWAKGRRCLIPANGFYEWKETGGVNQPYFIRHKTLECFAFAGLWAKNAGGLITFTILTKEADGEIASLHHRSPVLVDPLQAAEWFAAPAARATAMLQQSSARDMVYHPVDVKVGKVANDFEGLIKMSQPAALLV